MSLGEVLQILQVVEKIIAALSGMGVKMTGDVSIGDILKLMPKG